MPELTERQHSVHGVVLRECRLGDPVSAARVRELAWWADASSVNSALRSLVRRGLLSQPSRGCYLPTEENR